MLQTALCLNFDYLTLTALTLVLYLMSATAARVSAGVRWRGSLLFLPVLLVTLVIGSRVARLAEDDERDNQRRAVAGLAPTYALLMQQDGHERIRFDTPADDPTYLALIEEVKRLQNANPSIAALYTLKQRPDGSMALMVAPETDYDRSGQIDSSRERRVAIGEAYDDEAEFFARAARGELVIGEEPYTDEFGTWVTAAAPIRDSRGYIDAVVGVDIDGQAWLAALSQARLRVIYMTAAILGVVTGAFFMCMLLLRSLSVRRESETLLRHAARAADDANRAKSDFLANMSHEIRTPMTAILGYAELLREPDLSHQQFGDHVDSIQSNGRHLLALLSDILDFSKIEARAMTVERLEVEVDALLAGVKSIIMLRAQQKNVGFEIQIDPDAPTRLNTDPTRLCQVLVNLAGNAVKFTPPGGNVGLHVSRGADPASIRLAVIDTGIGMTAEQLSTCFSPFVQADLSTTRKFGGTGLGLSISRRLVELMGGEVTARSAPGRGSEFVVTLRNAVAANAPPRVQVVSTKPVAVPEKSAGKVESTTANQSQPTRGILAGLHVLIADDGADNRTLVSYHLRKFGATVACADDGRKAIDAIGESLANLRDPGMASHPRFDAIILDMQMPELSGPDVARQARRLGYQGPIIALTADVLDSTRATATAAGCDAFATKPLDSAALVGTIARLSGKQQRRAA